MTSDVQLRDVTADDLPIFFERQLDPDATEQIRICAHRNKSDVRLEAGLV